MPSQLQPSCISILRVGGPCPDSALLVTNALLDYFGQVKNNNNNNNSENLNCDDQAPIKDHSLLTLQNKYFSASIMLSNLLVHDMNRNQQSSSSSSYGDTNSNDSMYYYKEDGIVLVFDALKCNPDLDNGVSFDVLEAMHDRHLAIIATTASTTTDTDTDTADLLRLVVGVAQGQYSQQELRGSKHEQEYSKRILWCLDRGYEYVEVDVSPSGQAAGHDDRDKEGFARVVEAIQGTVWSSAIMMKKLTNVTSQPEQLQMESSPLDTNSERQEDNVSDAAADVDDNVDGNGIGGYEPPDPLAMGSFLKIEEPPTLVDDYIDMAETPEEEILRVNHQQEAQAFSELETLMKEANRIRHMSRNGDLPDDARRQRAAEAATIMMGLMEKMGIDDSDNEDDSDS